MLLKDQLAGLVPAVQANDIIKEVARGSSVLRLARVEAMTSDKKKFNVLTSGAGAYWVGEGARIQTSGATWIHPEIEAKKLAVIIPVTKEKLNDSFVDVFAELQAQIAEAFYTAIDAACLFGTSSPFAKSIYGVAHAAGKKVALKTSTSVDLDVADAMALIEAEGHDVNGFVSHYGMKNVLRKLRDGNGNQLFVAGVNQNELYGLPIEFSRNGAFDKTKAEMIVGNFDYAIVGIREGISYEILREATLQGTLDADSKPISLAEQDLVAIKATMRLGFLPVKEDAFALVTPKV